MPQIKSRDGTNLYYQINSATHPRAVALLVHGYADHSGRYSELVSELNNRGFTCYRFDYRGHGRSEGRRGHIDHFEDYLQDLQVMKQLVEVEQATLPRFIIAHSHGGLMTHHSLGANATGWSGAVFSSPFFDFQIKVPLWKRLLGHSLSRILPTFKMPTEIDPAWVSHDPATVEGYGKDPLIGRHTTTRWFTEVLSIHDQNVPVAQQLSIPILYQLAGDDLLVNREASVSLFEVLGSEDKTLKIYEDLYHEIWFEEETRRAPVLTDLFDWLETHIGEVEIHD